MKKKLKSKIIIFVLIGLLAFYLGLRFFGVNPFKSKATGETVTFDFNPSSASSGVNQDVSSTINAKPSLDMNVVGYILKMSFDKTKLQVKNIEYKLGAVSADLGQTNADLAKINQDGEIRLQGEISTATGQLITSQTTTDLVNLTFTVISSASATVNLNASESKLYYLKSDGTILANEITAASDFSVNGTVNSPIPTATTNPNETPEPTNPPNGGVKLNLKLKFQGILAKPADGLDKIGVTVTVVKDNNKQTVSNMMFVANDEGNWTPNTPMVFDQIPPGTGYYILVKGGKHLQRKICQNNPSETYPCTYHCDQGKITLSAGDNNLDFSGIVLLAGDLPEQDGIVNSYDTSLVRNNLGKTDADAIRLADINLDGIVDTQDYSLIIVALSIRTDEGESTETPTSVPTTVTTTAPTTPEPTAPPDLTITLNPTITGPGASGDLLRDGSTYPVYTSASVSFISCNGVTSPVSSVALSLLSQSQTHNSAILTYQASKPLLIGGTINVNDFLAQDLHKTDQEVYFGTTANLAIQATGMSNYSSNLNDAYFSSMSWCTASAGCLGVSDPELQNKRFIHLNLLRVCGL